MNAMAQFRLWRVLLVVGLFLAIFLAPILWQKYQEDRRREAAGENLRKIGDAVVDYQRRKTAEKAETSDASAPDETVHVETNDAE